MCCEQEKKLLDEAWDAYNETWASYDSFQTLKRRMDEFFECLKQCQKQDKSNPTQA